MAVLLVALLVMSGIGYAFYQKKHGRINWAQEQVAAKLFDGESARFRNVREVSMLAVCGEVNGKNRLGAYTGFTRFRVFGKPGEVVNVDIEDVNSVFAKINSRFMTEQCGEN